MLAFKLAANEIITMEDLAELAVPELIDIEPELSEETAAALILKAREPWFADEASEDGDSNEQGAAAP